LGLNFLAIMDNTVYKLKMLNIYEKHLITDKNMRFNLEDNHNLTFRKNKRNYKNK